MNAFSAIAEPPPRAVTDAPSGAGRTLWGLRPVDLHDRYWAALGVQVVRVGDTETEISRSAELFLLLDRETLVLFDIRQFLEDFTMLEPSLLRLRVQDRSLPEYAERLVTTDGDRFLRFERDYEPNKAGDTLRVALTESREVAGNWAAIEPTPGARRRLSSTVPRWRSIARRTEGVFTSISRADKSDHLVRDLVARWNRPDMTIEGLRRWKDAWIAGEGDPAESAPVVGRVWIGAGRSGAGRPVVGPDILWDDPEQRPEASPLRWFNIEPKTDAVERGIEQQSAHATSPAKRVFDIAFAVLALIALAPVFPIVALAIFIEDGRPIFFSHTRESIGGREFGCLKFRTMRKNAEEIKAQLLQENQADGPQFFIEDDPRITRVGRLLRKMQIDELPQFVNVLTGDMSIVGPRPSPRSENQYCPGWREARLSVRPGVTGLWQVRRTRAAGTDFQEWIRYDIEYVENASWTLDFRIIAQTMALVLRPLIRS